MPNYNTCFVQLFFITLVIQITWIVKLLQICFFNWILIYSSVLFWYYDMRNTNWFVLIKYSLICVCCILLIICLETLLISLPVKGCKFRPISDANGHWTFFEINMPHLKILWHTFLRSSMMTHFIYTCCGAYSNGTVKTYFP